MSNHLYLLKMYCWLYNILLLMKYCILKQRKGVFTQSRRGSDCLWNPGDHRSFLRRKIFVKLFKNSKSISKRLVSKRQKINNICRKIRCTPIRWIKPAAVHQMDMNIATSCSNLNTNLLLGLFGILVFTIFYLHFLKSK